jgi:hypothetical protein
VPIHDDPQFERYLKQFRPLEPEAMPKRHPGVRGVVGFFVWAAAAVVVLGAISLLISLRAHRTHASVGVGQSTTQEASSERLVSSKPLTVRSANALLATAPSFEEAIDEITASPETVPLPKGKHSALAVLSKGQTKL